MPYAFIVYPTPLAALVTITPDSGGTYTGVPYTDVSGRQGQVCYLNDGLPNGNGATLQLSASGHESERLRGFLVLDNTTRIARLQVDDVTLDAVADSGNGGGGGTNPGPQSPMDIINQVYAETQPQLWTHDGCGKFTEDCCTALHDKHSPAWGHIDKDPGQNQYNGHAVDAVMLMINVPGTGAGIYDIIFSSVSSEAKPAFNYSGPPNPDDWVYPAEAVQRGAPELTFSWQRRIPRRITRRPAA